MRDLARVEPPRLVLRIHGDYHLGQVLWADRDDWVVIDYEGEPGRSLAERRRRTFALRDVAGMLRSFAYAADASSLLAGVPAPGGWEASCRAAFLEGWRATVDPRLLPPSERDLERLLALCELQKLLYELRYELAHRPDWVGIPVAGLERTTGGLMSGLGEIDLYLAGEGRHERLYERLGAHCVDEGGVRFAVWAPNARAVSVVGDWNYWSEGADPLQPLGVVRDLGGSRRERLRGAAVQALRRRGRRHHPAQGRPVRRRTPRCRPRTRRSSTAAGSRGPTTSGSPAAAPPTRSPSPSPSTRCTPARGGRGSRGGSSPTQLVPYVAELGFTHVELMPVMQHPYAPSWGYQVSGYFAPQSTFGPPDDFRALVDAFHAAGIGVLLDWVPAHFPRDEWALARFDGTALYEHDDPRRGAHPDWGTLIFNLSRHEVRNFLLANALYWVREFHADGLRVDAVASMLYLDYSRDPGEWVPNEQGGRENLEAVAFLRELNEVLHDASPALR